MRIKYLVSTFLIGVAIVVVFPLILRVSNVHAQDSTVSKDELESLEEKIKKYEKKINDLQGRADTLSNEIEYMDSQISLTQLRIQSSTSKIQKAQREINELSKGIDDLKVRIDKLQSSIEYQKKVLGSRLRERYKTGEDSPILILFGASTITQLVQKAEYLRVMELQDNRLMAEMSQTKDAFGKQKQLFEDKKAEEEDLKKQLVAEKANLDAYKVTLQEQQDEKKRLLDATQNDEEKYQKLLAEAKRELDQILGAVGVLKNQSSKKVKKGQAIGTQGNTGYSFGAHLHFGVYKYSSFTEIDGWNWYYSNYVDPSKVLESKTVYWNTGCESAKYRKVGSGNWDWPLASPTVSQGFGRTCWSKVYYGGKVHPAYDMYGSSGSPVFAVADGNAYFCRNCLNDGGNGVFIFHNGGYMTVYWHLR